MRIEVTLTDREGRRWTLTRIATVETKQEIIPAVMRWAATIKEEWGQR